MALLVHVKCYEWSHTLADVMNALIGAGLRIHRVEELQQFERLGSQVMRCEPWDSWNALVRQSWYAAQITSIGGSTTMAATSA